MARFLPRRRWTIGLSALLVTLVELAIAARGVLPGWVEAEGDLPAEGRGRAGRAADRVQRRPRLGRDRRHRRGGRADHDRPHLARLQPWTLIREGHLSSIALSGVSIRLGIDRSGALDLPRMEALEGGGGGGGLGAIPFRTISISDSTIVLDTPGAGFAARSRPKAR